MSSAVGTDCFGIGAGKRFVMKRLLILAVLLLAMGCASSQKPSWMSSADMITESPEKFFTDKNDPLKVMEKSDW
jgi:hypothetical protein